MIIQLGFVLLFAQVFPLAPLIALTNNLIQIRLDAYKICYTRQRPIAQKTSGVGVWEDVIQVMSVIGILTSCGLMGFASKQLTYRLQFLGKAGVVLLLLGFEHAILLFKYCLHTAISRIPPSIARLQVKDRRSIFTKKIPNRNTTNTTTTTMMNRRKSYSRKDNDINDNHYHNDDDDDGSSYPIFISSNDSNDNADNNDGDLVMNNDDNYVISTTTTTTTTNGYDNDDNDDHHIDETLPSRPSIAPQMSRYNYHHHYAHHHHHYHHHHHHHHRMSFAPISRQSFIPNNNNNDTTTITNDNESMDSTSSSSDDDEKGFRPTAKPKKRRVKAAYRASNANNLLARRR